MAQRETPALALLYLSVLNAHEAVVGAVVSRTIHQYAWLGKGSLLHAETHSCFFSQFFG